MKKKLKDTLYKQYKKRQNEGFCLIISQKVKSTCQAHPAVVLSGLGLT